MRLPLVGSLIVLLGSVSFAQQQTPAPAPPAGALAPLALPPVFVRSDSDKDRNPALARAWTSRVVDVNGLRATISFPSDWRAADSPSGGLSLQLMSVVGLGEFSVAALQPFKSAPLSLNQPMSTDRLSQFSRGMNQSRADLKDVGQVKIGPRYWTWVDTLAPAAAQLPRTPSGDVVAIEPFHVWMFNSTEAGSLIQMSLSVVVPKGTAPVDAEADVHAAADVFLEILRRMTFEPGTSVPAAPQPRPARPDVGPLPDGVVRVGESGITAPVLLTQVQPSYTAEAMRARISGVVALECVVETDGSVGLVRVRRSLDAIDGLDGEAVKAAKQWRFKPGTKDGVPVRVAVSIEMSFTLRPPPSAPELH